MTITQKVFIQSYWNFNHVCSTSLSTWPQNFVVIHIWVLYGACLKYGKNRLRLAIIRIIVWENALSTLWGRGRGLEKAYGYALCMLSKIVINWTSPLISSGFLTTLFWGYRFLPTSFETTLTPWCYKLWGYRYWATSFDTTHLEATCYGASDFRVQVIGYRVFNLHVLRLHVLLLQVFRIHTLGYTFWGISF